MFNHVAIQMNYTNDELCSIIAQTDSRHRNDQRRFEEGLVDEADQEKIKLEVK